MDSLPTNNQNGRFYDKTTKTDFVSAPSLLRTDKDLNVKNLFQVTNNERITSHGQKINLAIASSEYSALLNQFYIGVRSVATSTNITLPPSSVAGLGKIYIVKDLSGSALSTTITITAPTGETIDGESTSAINTNYGKVGFFSDGQNWFTS